MLAAAIAESERTGTPIAESLSATARAAGKVIGEETAEAVGRLGQAGVRQEAVLEVLARHGYEPEVGKAGEIALLNCPFHRLAEEHRSLVCGMNVDFLGGLLEGIGPRDRARCSARTRAGLLLRAHHGGVADGGQVEQVAMRSSSAWRAAPVSSSGTAIGSPSPTAAQLRNR